MPLELLVLPVWIHFHVSFSVPLSFRFNSSFLEGCQIQQPILNSELVRVTVSSYLHCMEVGMKLLQSEGIKIIIIYLHCMEVGTKVVE